MCIYFDGKNVPMMISTNKIPPTTVPAIFQPENRELGLWLGATTAFRRLIVFCIGTKKSGVSQQTNQYGSGSLQQSVRIIQPVASQPGDDENEIPRDDATSLTSLKHE